MLGIGTFEIGLRDQTWTAVTGAGDEDHIQVVLFDQPVQMYIQQVQPRRGAPMAEQARLEIGTTERRFQQRVVLQINLTDRKIVGRTPIGVHIVQLRSA